MGMKKPFILLLLAFSLASVAWPQKAVRKIRTAVKAGNLEEAMKQIAACESDSLLADEYKVYEWGVRVQQRMNEQENEKIYLGQTCDTARFFSSVKGIFNYSVKAYEKGIAQGMKAVPLHEKTCARLWMYYPNLGVACHYYYKKGDYAQACDYLDTYIQTAQSPLFSNAPKPLLDELHLPTMAFFRLKSNYELGQYAKVIQDASLAMHDSLHHGSTLRYLSLASLREGKMEEYVAYLYRGLREAPGASFFYSQLSDYYQRSDQLGRALLLTDSLLQVRPGTSLYLFGKSYLLMKLKRYAESIRVSEDLLGHDDEWVEAYYNVGVCYCNMAVEALRRKPADVEQYKAFSKQVHDYYEAARPYLEHYREAYPDRVRKWGPLLYRVYLNLNMGDAFDEVDSLLKSAAHRRSMRAKQ